MERPGATDQDALMRLLLVEDELAIQDFLKRSLEEAGYHVDVAVGGNSAECLVSESAYDLLAVDLGLPDQDGITLILRLRQIGVRAPVLILSARRSVDDRRTRPGAGRDDYLTEPFAFAELRRGCATWPSATSRQRDHALAGTRSGTMTDYR